MSEGYHIDDEVQQRAYDGAIMRRLLGYVRPYRGWMAVSLLLLLGAAVVGNLTPLVFMRTVDRYVSSLPGGHDTGMTNPALRFVIDVLGLDALGLFQLTLLLSCLLFAEAMCRFFQLLIVSILGQHTMLAMRVGLFEHVQELSLRYLDRNPVGRLVSRITNDIEKIQQTIVTGVVSVLADFFTIAFVLLCMLLVNWQLALVTLLPMPFLAAASIVFRRFAQTSFLEVRKKIGRLSAHLQEVIGGIRIVQVFRREDDVYARYRAYNAEHRDEWLRQVRNFAVYFPVIDFLGTMATTLVIVYCAQRILWAGGQGSGAASIGTFYAYAYLAARLFDPIRALADRYNLLLEAMAASERVFQLQDTRPEILDPPQPHRPARIAGAVEFDRVCFGYDPGQPVVKNLSFAIAPGERVAIVGHTGAGKSTTINLLARFYDVDSGAVRVDGVDVRAYAQAGLRKHIGIVLQDVFLFSGTVEDNIRLGDAAMSFDHIRACAEHVNAARFIDRLPGRYQYNVGERGANLSTGQRQLLAFARALAHRPSILVLDEATSSIDTETEALIQDAIEKLMEGRTSIAIAHRLSTIQHSGRILVMHHGELRESGAHQELLALGGLYRTLYELQYKDQIVR